MILKEDMEGFFTKAGGGWGGYGIVKLEEDIGAL